MLRLSSTQVQAAAVVLGTLLSGCGGDSGGTPPSTITIAKTSGDNQVAVAGQLLAEPVTVTVTDGGTASVGTTVTWATTSGGSLAPTSGPTDANGQASATWTLGTTSGSQTATASVSGANTPATFTGTAEPDAAVALSAAGGDGQSGVINTALPVQVQAKVADQFGNGVAGVNVSWAATGATTSAPTVATNDAGISAVTVTMGGAEGPVTVTATADGLGGSPVTFNETATLAPPVPTTANVTVGAGIVFASNHNPTQNPAVDTVAAGGTVTWTWAPGSIAHSVRSTGSATFPSSAIQSSGTHAATFATAGTYTYDCAVHGSLMTGRVVVLGP
jgi:plastocyanin